MTDSYRLPETFETENYHLRRLRVEDAPAIFDAYAADPAVTKYLTWKPSRTVPETAAAFQALSGNWDRDESFPMVAFHQEQPGNLLGMFEARRIGSRVNYGYVLRASAWGKGCASEIMRALVPHALSHPKIFRTEAYCDVDNPASARVMEKAVMIREGILRRFLVHPNVSDEPRDCFVYSKVV